MARDVNCTDDYNRTPVYLASSYGYFDVVRCLYNTGKCDLFIKSKFGHTPLDIACLSGHHGIVEFIANVLTTYTLNNNTF